MTGQKGYLDELNVAIDAGDEAKISEIVGEFTPSNLKGNEQVEFLEALKRNRYFQELDAASNKFIKENINSPIITKLAAQAKIEVGDLGAAEDLLTSENINLDWGQYEKSEIVGLLGRLNKQKFVSTSKTSFLAQSIGFYDQGWQSKTDDYRWHGINSIALRARLDRENSSTQQQAAINQISREILEDIKLIDNSGNAKTWDYATAMEASLAINDYEGMYDWAKRYSTNSKVDSFQLAGTIRQLTEIWQINKDVETKQLLPVLQYELINRPGSSLSVESVEFYDGEGFEAFYGVDGTQTLKWFKTLISKCQSVVKIIHKTNGLGIGTGFIIKGDEINPAWEDKPILITNSHVICDDGSEPKALRPDQARIEFTELDGNPSYKIGEKIMSSPRSHLDFWISHIELTEFASPLSLSFFSPVTPLDPEFKERVYVVGYPRGGDLSVSMHGNALVGYDKPYVHYKSPTDKGCSGGPAMNQDLDCFAIHHRSRDELSVNQGVLLSEIKSFIN